MVETQDLEQKRNRSENKKPLEEPFLTVDPCKTNLLEPQQASKEMSTKINPTKYFVESY